MDLISRKSIYVLIATITALALALIITDHTKIAEFHDGGIHAVTTYDATDKSTDSLSKDASTVTMATKTTNPSMTQTSTAAQSH